MPYTDSDGIEIFYEVIGEPGHPVIVLISGTGAQLVSWQPEFMHLLVAEGFRVVRFDNRDTGYSQRFGGPSDIDGGYDLPDMAGDVMRVLDHLGVPAAHVVGHSMGGIIAQVTVLEHPHRVLSLGLLSTIPGHDPRYILHGDPVMAPPVRHSREHIVAEALEYAAPVPGRRYQLDRDWMGWAAGEAYDRGYAPEGMLRQWSALIRATERLELLRGVAVPTLVFHGRDDEALHWCSAVDIAGAIDDSELQVHAGMRHHIARELWPELVAGIVRAARRGEERTHTSR